MKVTIITTCNTRFRSVKRSNSLSFSCVARGATAATTGAATAAATTRPLVFNPCQSQSSEWAPVNPRVPTRRAVMAQNVHQSHGYLCRSWGVAWVI